MDYIKHKSEESIEDYLETILILSRRLPAVRSIDIANELHYSKPSISVAMKNLKGRNYITMSGNGHIELTEEGKKIAAETYERHILISSWFMELGVSPEVAVRDACRVEHDLSPETYHALKEYINCKMTPTSINDER